MSTAGYAIVVALSVAFLAMFISQAAYLGQRSWGMLLASLAGVLIAVFTWNRLAGTWTAAKMARTGTAGGPAGLPPAMQIDPKLARLAGNNPEVMRLLQIVAKLNDALMPVAEDFELDDDQKLVSYGFKSTRPGELATERQLGQVWDTLRSAFGSGWNVEFTASEESMRASKKSALPKLVNPPIRPVVRSIREAAEFYDSSEVHPGVGEDGEISIRLKNYVHWFLPGGTGGGKSVLARALLEERRAYGHRFYILDGKTTDYTPFAHTPNVVMISKTVPEHVMVIHRVAQIMRQRQAFAQKKSLSNDTSWRKSFAPITFIVDEWAVARNSLIAAYKKDLKQIDRDIEDILKLGREFRIHMIFSSQGTEAKTVPTDWYSQMRAVISLGPPSRMTVSKAFPADAQAEVTRIGQQISADTKGRAMVALTDDEGTVRPFLFQSYYSYSPGDSLEEAFTPEMRTNFEQFKKHVSDAIPQLYPREGFELEYPPAPEGGKDPYKDARGSGWVDLSLFSVDDLQSIKVVKLEDSNDGFAPIVENRQFDPLCLDYIGNEPMQGIDMNASYEDL